MLNALKTFQPMRLETDELIQLSAFARSLEAEYSSLKLEPPDWITSQTLAIRREIKARSADALASKLRAAKARLETLKTPDEKRRALTKEIKELEAQQLEASA